MPKMASGVMVKIWKEGTSRGHKGKIYGLFALLFAGFLALSLTDRPQTEKVDKIVRVMSAQEQRDENASLDSYWPTTLRVVTNMNSFWLDQEERMCWSVPNGEGKVAIVTCGDSKESIHNIPVKFWGGVDRGVASHWKCRREGNRFVCRAVD
jgi:hypothetical protein